MKFWSKVQYKKTSNKMGMLTKFAFLIHWWSFRKYILDVIFLVFNHLAEWLIGDGFTSGTLIKVTKLTGWLLTFFLKGGKFHTGNSSLLKDPMDNIYYLVAHLLKWLSKIYTWFMNWNMCSILNGLKFFSTPKIWKKYQVQCFN